jgi:two-component sensor histidine kinase
MDEVELVLDQAIPCALLINELITNALKYAFVNRNEGEVFLRLKEKDGHVILQIEDNGIGLPKDFDMLKSDTLGLQLVATLIEQLDGQISVSVENGTKYLLTFEKAKL